MAIICTKCGSTNVSCEAMINPNTNEIKKEIDDKYKQFIEESHREPKYANCYISWNDGIGGCDVTIKLSSDVDPDEDGDIFFYCNTLDGLKSLTEAGVEDFTITNLYSFEQSVQK